MKSIVGGLEMSTIGCSLILCTAVCLLLLALGVFLLEKTEQGR